MAEFGAGSTIQLEPIQWTKELEEVNVQNEEFRMNNTLVSN